MQKWKKEFVNSRTANVFDGMENNRRFQDEVGRQNWSQSQRVTNGLFMFRVLRKRQTKKIAYQIHLHSVRKPGSFKCF